MMSDLKTVSADDHVKVSNVISNAGDSMMQRIYQHVNGNGFHLSEQLDKDSGFEKNAFDLTWSYSAVLEAMYHRKYIGKRKNKNIDTDIQYE